MTVTASCLRLTVRRVLFAILASMTSVVVYSLPASASTVGLEADFACAINDSRTAHSRSHLRVNDELTRVARSHSSKMADAGYLYHNPNLTTTVSSWQVVAENVGRGRSVESIHRSMMDSTGHRSNILNDRVTEVGVGVVVTGSTIWVTQVFRQPVGSTSGTRPSCGSSASQDDVATPRGIPVAGDWNGDGVATPGRFDRGVWHLSDATGSSTWRTVRYGRAGDLPLVGDWNGDGKDTLGIVRDGEWHLRNDLNGGAAQITFRYGRVTQGDVPITGDWNGNGADAVGIIRDGDWHLRNTLSGGPGQIVFRYGRITRGDLPLIGDWRGNGHDRIGIVRGGDWHLRHSLSAGPGETVFRYGRVTSGDIPIIADFNGNGRASLAIVRGDEWHIRHTLSGGPAEQILRY